MGEITLKNIRAFIVGNVNYYINKMNLLPQYKVEQVLYRLDKCKNDCVVTGKCMHCGCPTQRKVFAPETCNNNIRFPDFMDENKWYEYKKQKKIDGSFQREEGN